MSEVREPHSRPDLGYHVMPGDLLLESLQRVENGEKADLVYAELWANASHDQVEPTEDWTSVLGECPHGVDLDIAFCPYGCRV